MHPADLPKSSAFSRRLADRPIVVATGLFAFALAVRWAALGGVAYANDEFFYWEAALRMHAGALLYVDVWDRKGPGLFATFWLITALSRDVLGFQLAGWLAASATALVLWFTARRMMGPAGAWGAALTYLAAMPMFGGAGGQSEVFYNFWMTLAGLLVWTSRQVPAARWPSRRILAAMLAAGFAITFKQCAAPEAAYLGLVALWRQRAGGARALIRHGLVMAAAGVAPFAVFGLTYLWLGQFPAFFDAMVSANLHKTYNAGGDAAARTLVLARAASPVLVLALAGLALPGRSLAARRFVGGWVLAALVGFAIVPNFYIDYVLPLLVPLGLAAGFACDRRPWGMAAGATAAIIMLDASGAFDSSRRDAANARLRQLVATIAQRTPVRPGERPRVLVYEGPMALYGLIGSYPPSPLLDNAHLYFPPENNASRFDTAAEMARDLAWRPQVVLTYRGHPEGVQNPRTAAMVRGYIRHCRHWQTLTYPTALVTISVDV